MDPGSFAGLKALYSDARKRAAVAAGIGAYLYTSLEAVVLPIGPHPRQVQCIRRAPKSDLLLLSPETEQWLRHGYQTRQALGGAKVVLGTVTNNKAMTDTLGGLTRRGELVVMGVNPEPFEVNPFALIGGGHKMFGHASGTSRRGASWWRFG